jgi:hypothetical protein
MIFSQNATAHASGLHIQCTWFKHSAVRGSPLLRTFLIALCLGLAALPLWRMTQPKATVPIDIVAPATNNTTMTVPFGLKLSASAKQVILRDENSRILWESAGTVAAEVEATWPRLPSSVQIEVEWTDAATAPRYFAKLRLDPPGRDTLTHVFDASTNLDDLWELP